MGLSLLDCKAGTIVDHSFERRADGKVVMRQIRKRGIIVGAEGEGDSIPSVMVKFGEAAKAEKIDPFELVRVHKATSKISQEAYRRVMHIPMMVGEQFDQREIKMRPKLVDDLALTHAPKVGPVEPEYDKEPVVTAEPEVAESKE